MDEIPLYEGAAAFLRKLKLLEETSLFKSTNVTVSHFIVTAGLKELVELVLPKDLITWTFGCCYKIVVAEENKGEPESVPVFCMDETMKLDPYLKYAKARFAKRSTR